MKESFLGRVSSIPKLSQASATRYQTLETDRSTSFLRESFRGKATFRKPNEPIGIESGGGDAESRASSRKIVKGAARSYSSMALMLKPTQSSMQERVTSSLSDISRKRRFITQPYWVFVKE